MTRSEVRGLLRAAGLDIVLQGFYEVLGPVLGLRVYMESTGGLEGLRERGSVGFRYDFVLLRLDLYTLHMNLELGAWSHASVCRSMRRAV